MLQTILVYLSLIFVMYYLTKHSADSYNSSINKSNLYLLISMTFFSIIFGLRYYVGVDYANYLNVYEHLDYRVLRYEPLFLAITMFCQKHELHFCIYFGLIAFVQIFFLFFAFRKRRFVLPFMISILILSGDIMTGWMNILRHYIAINIFICATSFLSERNLKNILLYYVFIVIATLTHSSALILVIIPVYLLRKSWFNNITLQCLLVISFFCLQSLGISSLIFSKIEQLAIMLGYNDYTDGLSLAGAKIGIFDIMSLFFYLFIIINSKYVKSYFRNDKFFILIYDFSIIGIILTYFFSGSMMLKRMSLYFYAFIYPLFAYYLYYYSLSQYRKVKYCVVVLYFIFAFIRIMMSMTINTTQYVFFFQKELCVQKELQRYERNVNVN